MPEIKDKKSAERKSFFFRRSKSAPKNQEISISESDVLSDSSLYGKIDLDSAAQSEQQEKPIKHRPRKPVSKKDLPSKQKKEARQPKAEKKTEITEQPKKNGRGRPKKNAEPLFEEDIIIQKPAEKKKKSTR